MAKDMNSPEIKDGAAVFQMPVFRGDLLSLQGRNNLEKLLESCSKSKHPTDRRLRGIGFDVFFVERGHFIVCHPGFIVMEKKNRDMYWAENSCEPASAALKFTKSNIMDTSLSEEVINKISGIQIREDAIQERIGQWPFPWNVPNHGRSFYEGPSSLEGSGYLSVFMLCDGISLATQENGSYFVEKNAKIIFDPLVDGYQKAALAITGIRADSTGHSLIAARSALERNKTNLRSAWSCVFDGDEPPAIEFGEEVK